MHHAWKMEQALSYSSKDLLQWLKDNSVEKDQLFATAGFGLDIITSDMIPDGEIYYVGGNIILGTGVSTDHDWCRREVRRIFQTDPSMRKWYIYAGLIVDAE